MLHYFKSKTAISHEAYARIKEGLSALWTKQFGTLEIKEMALSKRSIFIMDIASDSTTFLSTCQISTLRRVNKKYIEK